MNPQNGRLVALSMVLAAGNAICAETPSTTDPLLDLFVKKGYVTQAEANQVKAEAQAMQTNGAAYVMPEPSKWKLNQGMQLFGDARLRYEDRSVVDPAHNQIDMSRLRYSLRFGVRGDLFDDFYYGFRLDTAANPRSSWVTMGSSSSSSPYQGPFGKSSATIAVGQIYLGWHPESWFDIALGKMPNPLYTTPMVWDSDLNPEGAAEHFKHNVGPMELFANFGQFLYADLNPNYAKLGLGFPGLVDRKTDNIFLFAWQGGFDYHITTNFSAKVAATLYKYAGLHRSSPLNADTYSPYFGDPYVGEGAYYYYGGANPQNPEYTAPGGSGYAPGRQFQDVPGDESVSFPFNQVGLNHLLVVEIPFELDFKIKSLAARVFGDFAYNLEGRQRAEDAAAAYSSILSSPPRQAAGAVARSFPAQTDDVKAYQIGLGIGSGDLVYGPTKGLVYGTEAHRHDWEFRTYWQHIEQYSLDPNLIDSDFFEGRENMQGIYAALAYAVTDNLIATIRYGYAMRINDLLGTGGDNQDIPQMNPIDHYNLLQVDATVRF
jgi:Putative porin